MIKCEVCGDEFIPDDENDKYCCEMCLDISNGEYDDEDGDDE